MKVGSKASITMLPLIKDRENDKVVLKDNFDINGVSEFGKISGTPQGLYYVNLYPKNSNVGNYTIVINLTDNYHIPLS
jgi:hypothetical protein